MKVLLNAELIDLMVIDQMEYLDRVKEADFKETPFTREMLENYDEKDLDMFPNADHIYIGCNSVCQASGLFYIADVSFDGIRPTTLDEYEFFGHVEGNTLVVDLASMGGTIVYGDEEDLIEDGDYVVYKETLKVLH